MSDNKKKRLSMLDNLAAASPPAPSSLMKTNRPLRAARDAVDGHKVWDLDPNQIIDARISDRLDLDDIADLRDSIEATGQSVPILVRRHPSEDDKYYLVYGRRRLEAIRSSDTVKTVRALIANMDDTAAVETQISENIARRDLSFIEKALFAHELIKDGFGKQTRVAEVLTVSKSAISMALAIVGVIGPDVIRAIGPAHGVGRPRWDALAKALETSDASPENLIHTAERAHNKATVELVKNGMPDPDFDPSVVAFDAVYDSVMRDAPVPKRKPKTSHRPAKTALVTGGRVTGALSRNAKGIQLEIGQGDFADWVEDHAQTLIEELHARWKRRGEEP